MRGNNARDEKAYRDWASQIATGVEQIITGRRGTIMSRDAKLDLCNCLNLMDGKEPLPFDWDVTLYTNPPPLPTYGPPKKHVNSVNHTPPGDASDEEYDLSDMDTVARPHWSIGEVHIVKLTASPFWTMARYHNDPCT